MICSKCKKSIIKYPCPHCGKKGETFQATEGTTGGGD